MNKAPHSRGFTIVELLIVIVIIAILAAVSIVAFNGVRARAHESAALSNYEKVAKAAALYKENFSRPAADAQELKNETGLYQLGTNFPLIAPPDNMLRDVYFKNNHQTEVVYIACSNGQDYMVFSYSAVTNVILGKSNRGATMHISPGTLVYGPSC